MQTLAGLSRYINRAMEISLFVLGFSMAIIVAVQVFFRYVLNHSLFWSEELARYLLIWLTFLGASVAYYHEVHPGIDALYIKLPPVLKKFCRIIVHLSSLILFAIMISHGIRFVWFVRMQISPALNLPKWIIFSIIPLSGIILSLHAFSNLLHSLKDPGRDH